MKRATWVPDAIEGRPTGYYCTWAAQGATAVLAEYVTAFRHAAQPLCRHRNPNALQKKQKTQQLLNFSRNGTP